MEINTLINFEYCCLVIPTTPKAKRIWLCNIPFFELGDILGKGLIMIFELKTNKILRDDPNMFYLGRYLDKDIKERPEVYIELAKMLKNAKF